MSDLLPKMKLFMFLSVIQLIINFGIAISSGKFDIVGWAGMIGAAFIPFVSMVSLIYSGFPIEINAIFLAIVGIIAGLQTYMVGSTIWSLIPFVNA